MSQQRRRVSSSGDTVTVACKLPHGLIMRVFRMVERSQPVMGGGTRIEKIAEELPERVTLAGFSHEQIKAPNAPLVGGFALTRGVDREFWELWLDQNRTSDMVRNGLIFSHTQYESTEDEAKDKKDVKSNLERLDPNKLPRGVQRFEDKPVA